VSDKYDEAITKGQCAFFAKIRFINVHAQE